MARTLGGQRVIARDLDRARTERFDLVIVGGGLQGAALLLEAARRGHKTALVERDDFGGATSWNSLRLAHGGIRDLQRFDIGRCRRLAAAQRDWLRDFPDAVRPISCVLPLDGRRGRRPWVVGTGLLAHALLTRGVRDPRSIPAGSLADHPRHGRVARWHEGLMTGPRLTIEMLRWACSLGAVALHRTEVVGKLSNDAGVEILDRHGGETFGVRARQVIVAAGAATETVIERLTGVAPRRPNAHPSLAFNLLLDRRPEADEVLVRPGVDGTRLFVPVGSQTLVGTFHAPIEDAETSPGTVSDALVDAALESLGIGRTDVDRVLSGVLPARRPGTTRLVRRPIVRAHRFGLTSVVAVKWTSVRQVASRVLDRCLGAWPGRLDRSTRPEPAVVPDLDTLDTRGHESLSALRRLIET
ncbi:MAG: FAD-dependent oxidoreductase, partial [Acidobacteriota bacterium]